MMREVSHVCVFSKYNYELNIVQKTACMVLNSIVISSFAVFWKFVALRKVMYAGLLENLYELVQNHFFQTWLCFQTLTAELNRKVTFRICKNKGEDQLRSNCKAGHRLCFCYTDSTIPLLSKFKISSL